MWTPKRIILFAIGFAAFFTAYMLYAFFLGGIDGLPPLPISHLPIQGTEPLPPPPPRPESSAAAQLRLAFGEKCNEAGYKIILELQPRGMVIATEDAKVQDDGTVKLTPFSLAIIKRDHGTGAYPEINRITCKEAVLRFDRPVKGAFDMGGTRKIVGCKLEHDILLVNNRQTKQEDDDISLSTEGPVEYDEARHLIWTRREVRVVDRRGKPEPMEVTGVGMDIELPDEPAPTSREVAKAGRTRNEGPSGVNRIRLQEDVHMFLSSDSQTNFFGSGKKPAVTSQKNPRGAGPQSTEPVPAERARVVIITQGPFSYDLRADHATFEIAHKPGETPNVITVDRFKLADGTVDHLQCDERLELQFRRKNKATASTPAPAQGTGAADGPEIETIHATGKEVVISSEAEMLNAQGTDLFCDRTKHLTTLKGVPQMWAIKEGTEIKAAELQLLDVKGNQQATALGEGQISLFDKNTLKRPMEASWKKKLVYAKEGNVDVLTLFGDAVFNDLEHKQQLKAETLKVWLAPAEPGTGPKGEEQRRKPQHLDAIEHVSSDGPDLHVHDTEHLEVWFKDVPPAQGEHANATQSSNPEKGNSIPGATHADGAAKTGSSAGNQGEHPQNDGLFPGAPNENSKNKKPIDLSAKLVQTYVLRSDNKNELDRVNCEGAVRVYQAPAAPGDKPVDIRGEYLQITHHVDGNEMNVKGEYAQVQMNQIYIVGPVVNINQSTNQAWVDGIGVMKLPSKNNLDGTPLAHETELVIAWEKAMFFDGQMARFEGKVRATQEQGRLATEVLKVHLDRKISLREGAKDSPPAKMQTLICEGGVWVEDTTMRDGKLISQKRIHGAELFADCETEKNDNRVQVSGPGMVRIFQLGTKGQLFPGQGLNPGQPNAPQGQNNQQSEEFKLTQVTFQGRMQVDNKKGIAYFWDDVVVYQVPTENRDLKIDDLKPPPESMRMSCRTLEVKSQKNQGGATQQEMHAEGKVLISGQDYSGSANTVDYDENKGQVILRGTEPNPAVLVKQVVKGGNRPATRAATIMYWPRTGQILSDGTTKFEGQ